MYINPYSEATFIHFWKIFLERLIHFFPCNLATDEIQILTLSLVAAASAMIGTFLVLQKMTMLANALSHTSLIGIAFVYLLFPLCQSTSILLLAALFSGLLTTFLTEFFSKIIKVQEDASIGLVFTTLFALGVLLVTVCAKDAHIGVELVMGNADSLTKSDLKFSLSIFVINILFIFSLFKELKITTFDPFLSKTMGFSPTFFKWQLLLFTSITTLCAFRAVGVLMVLAFLTGPPLIARIFTYRLSQLLVLSSLVGIFAVFLGCALSRHILSVYGMPLSTGAIVVCMIVLLYLLAFLFKERRRIGYSLWFRKKIATAIKK